MNPTTIVVLWVLVVVGAEALLPTGPTSWLDVVGVLAVFTAALVTWSAVEARDITVSDRTRLLVSRIRAAFQRFDLKVGIDLRGDPPYPRRLPTSLVLQAGVGAVLLTIVLLNLAWFPAGIRETLVPLSAVAYLALATLAWIWTTVMAGVAAYFFWLHTNDLIINRSRPLGWRPRYGIALPWAMTIGVLGATMLLPAWLPFGVVATVMAIGLLLIVVDRKDPIRLVWRARTRSDVSAIGSSWMLAWGTCIWSGLALVTIAVTTGAAWTEADFGGPTVVLGSIAGWCGVLGASAWLWTAPVRMLRLRARDPARPEPTAVRLVSDAEPDDAVVAELAVRGIAVTRADPAEAPHPISILLDPSVPPRGRRTGEVHGKAPVWTVHPDDLTDPDVLSQLRAADRDRRRDELLDGLRTLLATSRLRRFRAGSGFWFAPHLWYVAAMSRDTDEMDSVSVGPPYHHVLSRRARQHCHEVFRAVAVDLVFIEDGVDTEGVATVLRQLFDHFDVWGVDPIEERHFRGVPGIRVVVQDVALDTTWEEEGYPEPDYDEIGRARILHVMKERGGGDEEVVDADPPVEEPELVGAS